MQLDASQPYPRISVITIVLNGAATIERTIQSVLSQPYSNFEYIIIDGGSTDGTIDILKRFNSQIDLWVSKKDTGISDAFNRGIRLSAGEWIGFINADDWYSDNAFAEVGENNSNCDIFYGLVQYWDGDKKREIFDADHTYLQREMTINHPACFFKRSIFNEIGNFNQEYKLAMDYEFLLRCLNHSLIFKKYNSVLANMSYGGVSDNSYHSYREVRRAKLESGMSPMNTHLYYYFQLLRKGLRNLLYYLKLSIIVDAYRKYFAIIKKNRVVNKQEER